LALRAEPATAAFLGTLHFAHGAAKHFPFNPK
jgi:hypothetical protein